MREGHCHGCNRLAAMVPNKKVGGTPTFRCQYCGFHNDKVNVVIIRMGAKTCLGCGQVGMQVTPKRVTS